MKRSNAIYPFTGWNDYSAASSKATHAVFFERPRSENSAFYQTPRKAPSVPADGRSARYDYSREPQAFSLRKFFLSKNYGLTRVVNFLILPPLAILVIVGVIMLMRT